MLLIFSLLLSACATISHQKEAIEEIPSWVESAKAKCNQIINDDKKYICLRDIALSVPDTSVCEQMEKNSSKDLCYLNIAVEKMDLNICKKIQKPQECYIYVSKQLQDSQKCDIIKDAEYRQICYVRVAESNSDLTVCNKIKNIEAKEKCYSSVAIKTLAPKICEQIKNVSTSDGCYYSIAEKNSFGNKSICEGIRDNKLKKNCESQFKTNKDVNTCDSLLTEDEKNDCYEEVAMSENDSFICDNINNSSQIGRIDRNGCYLNVARLSHDEKDCSKIQAGHVFASECYSKIAEIKNAPSICTDIIVTDKDDFYDKINCYLMFGNKLHAEFCNSITEELSKSICLISLSTLMREPGICETVSKDVFLTYMNITIYDHCYFEWGRERADIELCMKISNQDLKDACVAEIARIHVDPDVCEIITNPGGKNLCFVRAAWSSIDISLCNKISEEEDKEICKNYINRNNEDGSK